MLGDLIIDLPTYDHYAPTNEFLNSLSPHKFLPYIIQPSRVTSNSNTLSDDMLPHFLGVHSLPVNFSGTFSDRRPQFVIAPNSPLGSKSNMKGIGLNLTK